jgi:F420-0:gamma-glutamyl ligase-like protein
MDMLAGIRIAKKLDGQNSAGFPTRCSNNWNIELYEHLPRYSGVDILTIIEDLAATTFHKVKNVSPELMKCV